MQTSYTQITRQFFFIALFLLGMTAPAMAKKSAIKGVININTATPEQLTLLPRVGKKIAARIIKYRVKFKKFKSTTEIMKVRGIGKKTFAKMKKNLTTQQPTKFTLAN